MDYIVKRNPKITIKVRENPDGKRPALETRTVAAYARALRKITGKGGGR